MNKPQFDEAYDVIVVGSGAAGSAAAITAHDEGASVLVIEKMPYVGGNTGVAGGNMTIPREPDKFKKYLDALCFGTTEFKLIDLFVEELVKNPAWIKKMGAELRRFSVPPASCSTYIPDITFPGAPYGEDVDVFCIKESDIATSPCGGQRLIQVLKNQMQKRQIKIMNNTAATELIKSDAGVIVGVIAETGVQKISFKANKGVVLCCGGFENNDEMKKDYLQPKIMRFSGNPGNTGDGIRMVQKIGGSPWHMSAYLARCGIQTREFDATFSPDFIDPGFIWVDKNGYRFANEGFVDVHLFSELLAEFDNDAFEYTRIPFYAIFDDKLRRKGPVCWGTSGPNIVHRGYKWSSDNSVEIKKGWIIEAKSVADLAERTSVEPEILENTIDTYNRNAAAGQDPDFGRSKDVLRPLEGPPYYALELWPSIINTQGGPKRDAKARVLDPDMSPIPGLYAAGEFGSIWGFKYQTSTNISEALIFGRIAGRNAVGNDIRQD